jgi:hypothetical protein
MMRAYRVMLHRRSPEMPNVMRVVTIVVDFVAMVPLVRTWEQCCNLHT